MKKSTEIFAELNEVLARIRGLHSAGEANQPLRYGRRFGRDEEVENEKRRDRCAQISRDIANAEATAAQLRQTYTAAIAEEQKPPVAGPSEALKALYAKRDELQRQLDVTREARSSNALQAAEGNAKARAKVDQAFDTHAAGIIQLSNLNLAIEAAEKRDVAERGEAEARAADEKFAAGMAAVEALVVWSDKAENHLDYLSNHLAKLADLKKALAKSGASVNTDLTNRLFTKAAFDRAAKAKGLHHFFSIDATVDAAALNDQFKSLLKAAVRPTKGKAA